MSADSAHLNTRSQAGPPPANRAVVVVANQAFVVVALLFMFMILNFADKAVVGLVGVEMKRDIGITPSQFGLVQSSFFWTYAIGAIVGGALMRRLKARWLIAISALLWGASLIPMIWSESFTVLIISRMLLGFSEGPTAALAFGLTHSWFAAEKRALPTSIVAAGASMGPVVAAPAITAVTLHFGWHGAFAVAAGAAVVWVVLWLILGDEGPEDARAIETVSGLPEHVPYRRLLTSRTITGIIVLFFVSYGSVALTISWLPLYLREGLGYDAVTVGGLATLPYIGGAVLMLAAGAISRAMTKRGVGNRAARGIFSAALVFGAGLSTFAFAAMERGPLQILLIVIGVGLVGAAQGVSWSVVSDVVPPKQRGPAIGFIVFAYSMGGVIAPLALGFAVQGGPTVLSGYSHGFTVLGIVMMIGAGIAGVLIDPEHTVRSLVAKHRGACAGECQ